MYVRHSGLRNGCYNNIYILHAHVVHDEELRASSSSYCCAIQEKVMQRLQFYRLYKATLTYILVSNPVTTRCHSSWI